MDSLIVRGISDIRIAAQKPFGYRREIHTLSFYAGAWEKSLWQETKGYLEKFSCIRLFSVEGHNLPEEAGEIVGQWLAEQRVLEAVILSRNTGDLTALTKVYDALRDLPTLTQIALNSMQSSGAHLNSLVEGARWGKSLEALSFCNNTADKSSLHFAKNLLSISPHLHTAILGHSFFMKTQGREGLAYFLAHPSIKRLQINGMECTETLSYLPKPPPSSLRQLYARMLQGPVSGVMFFRSQVQWIGLKTVSLSHNPWLAQNFFLHTVPWQRLEWLDLGYCRLTEQQEYEMLELYEGAPDLIGLSLQGNFGLGPCLVKHLHGLQWHVSLTWLNLSGIECCFEDWEKIFAALTHMPSLTTLKLCDMNIPDTLLKNFLQSLPERTYLTEVDCGRNNLPVSTMVQCQMFCESQKRQLKQAVYKLHTGQTLNAREEGFLRAHLYSYQSDIWKIFPISERKRFCERYDEKRKSHLEEYVIDLWQDRQLSVDRPFMFHPFCDRPSREIPSSQLLIK